MAIMNTKLYVDNLPTTTTGCDLMKMFSAHGNVAGIGLPLNYTNGRPRGFGFVTMATPEGARAAVRALHGKQIGTRTLTVSESWPQEEHAGMSAAGNRPAMKP